jgi:hypothetical protein
MINLEYLFWMTIKLRLLKRLRNGNHLTNTLMTINVKTKYTKRKEVLRLKTKNWWQDIGLQLLKWLKWLGRKYIRGSSTSPLSRFQSSACAPNQLCKLVPRYNASILGTLTTPHIALILWNDSKCSWLALLHWSTRDNFLRSRWTLF